MKCLVLPLRLQALWLRHGVAITGPLQSPQHLPWVDGRTGFDRNSDHAWGPSTCELPPFETTEALQAGVHLHWVLPSLLRRGRHPLDPTTGTERLDDVRFLRAPNRWLVRRERQSGGAWTEEARWLVQSDHVWPEDVPLPRGTIHAVLPPWVRRAGAPPTRGLGRVLPVEPGAPLPVDTTGWEELTGLPLTALGPWEDLSFAAMYPSCRHIFGLHDPAPGDGAMRWSVVGWEDREARDPVVELLAAGRRSEAFAHATDGDVLVARWGEDLGEMSALQLDGVARLMCFGQLTLDAPSPAQPRSETVRVALGHSPQAALVAHLADDVAAVLPGTGARVEESLLAVHQSRTLEGSPLELGPRLQQAVHRDGFDSVPGGTRFVVVRREGSGGATPSGAAQLTLPATAAHALEVLNRAQAALDARLRALDREADGVVADHTRLMRAVARPPDRPQDAPDLDRATDALLRRLSTRGRPVPGSLRAQLDQLPGLVSTRDAARSALQALVDAHNAHGTDGEHWRVRPTPATRFWRPRDPAVLLSAASAGDPPSVLRPSPLYHGPAPRPEVVELPAWDPSTLVSVLADPEAFSFDNGDHSAVLMEWRTEVLPARSSRHLDPAERRYAPDWLQSGYRLGETEADLERRDPAEVGVPAAVVSTGRCILTPSSAEVLRADLLGWLDRWMQRRLADWRAASEPVGTGHTDLHRALVAFAGSEVPPELVDTLPRDAATRASFLAWLASVSGGTGPLHPAEILLAAWDALRAREGALLGQPLHGFHRALIGLRDAAPLELANPLGFSEYQAATAAVRDAVTAAKRIVHGHTRPRVRPDPDAEFLPLRAGDLRLLDLRLVDSFGRPTDLRWTEVDRPSMWASPVADRVALPPRFVQPARLDFRWLSAEPLVEGGVPDAESTPHPAASPVCGWLVADHIDRSILVYDQHGAALGSVEAPGLWRLPPGETPTGERPVLRPGEIPSPGLRAVVAWLVDGARSEGFLDATLDAIEAAQERIAPGAARLHEARALLSSRPLAVVRARIRLELDAPPAEDQSWLAWTGRIETGAPRTRAVERVTVPTRIGEHRRLDDGVVGYFVKAADGSFAGDRLFCPQGLWADGGAGDSRVVAWSPGHAALHLELSAAADPSFLTVLMDPGGRLHATTGLLPARALSLPADQTHPALARIAPWFRAMPILTGPRDVSLPLPAEDDATWQWVARAPHGWEQAGPDPRPSASAPAEARSGPDLVPSSLAPSPGPTIAREGWLRLVPRPAAKES